LHRKSPIKSAHILNTVDGLWHGYTDVVNTSTVFLSCTTLLSAFIFYINRLAGTFLLYSWGLPRTRLPRTRLPWTRTCNYQN